jgi:hypothetical protein
MIFCNYVAKKPRNPLVLMWEFFCKIFTNLAALKENKVDVPKVLRSTDIS